MSLVKLIRTKLRVGDTMAEDMDTAVRAPLASQEAMEESPMQICGQISEYTRGKEFKVGHGLKSIFSIIQ